jgi:uncharacterized protein
MVPPARASASSAPAHTGRVDARSPLVLDTRELGRRPGSMREVRRTLPAPPDWELPLVGVPVGSEVTLDLRLEAVMDGVLVTGSVSADLAAECGRCLEPVTSTLTAAVQELFSYEAPEGDDDAPLMVGDFIDLEPVLRDAVVLALPATPLCSPDCAGLCSECGARLEDAEVGHNHETLDPRWAALSGLSEETEPKDPAQIDPAPTKTPDRKKLES